ncbi:ribosome biogenesis protein Nop16 [Thamnocephalis sphaerospora]|uniref:Nucleolar protein 16 n=1 Tax=Thamnocephalis sphaerospora TaxID=78915 RepID=A0A4V1IX72_9FUNG|nr:ribosome biogenesis protein Nop16 [Thamnocephalis sphaerospora]|eukprot:RKP10049.1 ribosome biogenesis protein Nop16 [Thamnocephalis sphaerospora]
MGKRPHARRVNRQPTQKNTRRLAKRTARKRPMTRDPMVAKHWDERLTVRQNYARLGLAHRVNGVSGGMERSREVEEAASDPEDERVRKATFADPLLDGSLEDPFEMARRQLQLTGEEDLDEETLKKRLGPGRAMIKRDDQGNIIKVVMGTQVDSDDEDTLLPQVKARSKLVEEMERQVAEHVPFQRFLSPGEIDWAKKLIAKHGDNYQAMFRDMKLNKLQRTVSQIRRVCEQYLASTQA